MNSRRPAHRAISARPSAIPVAMLGLAILSFGSFGARLADANETPILRADDGRWSGFRGPGSLGVVPDDPRLPDTWGPDENIAWKVAVPGLGWSSPIVWDDAVFVTTCKSSSDVESPQKGLYFGGERPKSDAVHQWMVIKFDFQTGAEQWRQVCFEGVPPANHHLKNTYASETPVTDGERVYAFFGNIGMFCFDMAGRKLWERPFPAHETFQGWGTGASPALYDGRLYVVCDNEEASYLVALDALTGEEVWKVDRKDEKSNWVTPYVWKNELRTEIVTCGLGKNRSYDLDGNLLWELKGMSRPTIPTPFSKHGLLYVSSGWVMDKFKPVYAIKPGASGDISLKPGEKSNEFIVWFTDKVGSYHPSALVIGDLYYTLHDQGFFLCNDARTGEVVYGKKRIDDRGQAGFTVSPWSYNGKIFCLNEDGVTYVIQAGPEFKVLGKNDLGEFFMASPAIAHGDLILRSSEHLYRIHRAE